MRGHQSNWRTTNTNCAPKSDPCGSSGHYGGQNQHTATWVVWFLVVSFIIFFILIAAKPDFIRKKDREDNCNDDVDIAKAIGWSLVIAFVISIILGVLWWFSSGGMRY